jgi:hypothetical protein
MMDREESFRTLQIHVHCRGPTVER